MFDELLNEAEEGEVVRKYGQEKRRTCMATGHAFAKLGPK